MTYITLHYIAMVIFHYITIKYICCNLHCIYVPQNEEHSSTADLHVLNPLTQAVSVSLPLTLACT